MICISEHLCALLTLMAVWVALPLKLLCPLKQDMPTKVTALKASQRGRISPNTTHNPSSKLCNPQLCPQWKLQVTSLASYFNRLMRRASLFRKRPRRNFKALTSSVIQRPLTSLMNKNTCIRRAQTRATTQTDNPSLEEWESWTMLMLGRLSYHRYVRLSITSCLKSRLPTCILRLMPRSSISSK